MNGSHFTFVIFAGIGQIVVIVFLVAMWRLMRANERIADSVSRLLPVQEQSRRNLEETVSDLSLADKIRLNKAVKKQERGGEDTGES